MLATRGNHYRRIYDSLNDRSGEKEKERKRERESLSPTPFQFPSSAIRPFEFPPRRRRRRRRRRLLVLLSPSPPPPLSSFPSFSHGRSRPRIFIRSWRQRQPRAPASRSRSPNSDGDHLERRECDVDRSMGWPSNLGLKGSRNPF